MSRSTSATSFGQTRLPFHRGPAVGEPGLGTCSDSLAGLTRMPSRQLTVKWVTVPKVRDAVKLIESDGWREVVTRGSHRQFKHPTKPGRVTIAGHPSDDLAPGTFNSILKQAGLKG